MKIIFHWALAVIAIAISAYLIPGVTVTLAGAIVLAVVLGVINLFIKPIVSLLTLPLTILTLGIFSLIVNALFILLADAIVPGFEVAGFWSAVIFALVLALVNAFFHVLNRND